ncbi:MAG: PDZ domain-containing protein [Paraglaciecola polaris]|uniref:M61 family metallopeptidase n=1 Tax=Paraglaciecola polaris TaxID=222814 RepID=UPI003002F9DA|tara:strand:- start:58396 stop:60255 length:1860 start_codon:yes stop_codon:yes gene_type:complete
MSQHSAAIHYTLDVSSLAGHILGVVLHIDLPSSEGHVLSLPAWIPGSYMIRDFAKNIVQIHAEDEQGVQLTLRKNDKQTWQLPPTSGPIKVHYRIYAFDLSVRSAYVFDDFAFFNGTSTFLAVEEHRNQPCGITLMKPKQAQCSNWRVATTLPVANNTLHHDFGDYLAADYNELIDHPILLGEYDIVPFDVVTPLNRTPLEKGMPPAHTCHFELILAGGHRSDTQRIAKDLRALCAHHFALFNDVPPIDRYLFITMLTGRDFGGLEHMSSTALLYSRDDLPSIAQADHMPDGYRTFLSLCSHEFLHTWHVKRTRPAVLKSSTLAEEAYTPQLWIYEGFTSYYDDMSLARSQVTDVSSYLEVLGQTLTRLERNIGRHKQTVTESSFDAWTKFYQQDASAINNIVSYYVKGAVIALCLDLQIRLTSQHKRSLDDVMRYLWQHHGKIDVGTPDDIIQQIILVEFELPLQSFMHDALYTNKDLPVQSLLETFGVSLQRRPRVDANDIGGKPATRTRPNHFGAAYKAADTGVIITQVSENTPAFHAGLQVGDQLISLNDWQLTNTNLLDIYDHFPESSDLVMFVLRHQRLKQLTLTINQALHDTIFLTVNDEQKLLKWLSNKQK